MAWCIAHYSVSLSDIINLLFGIQSNPVIPPTVDDRPRWQSYRIPPEQPAKPNTLVTRERAAAVCELGARTLGHTAERQ